LLPVLAALAFAGVSLAGCAAQTFPRPKFAAQASSALAKVSHEPPPARVETTPPRPATPPGTVWVDGEWSWKRRRWAWTPGRWVLPPAGATYSPWVTVRAPDGTLYFAPAVWHDAAGKPLAAPKPIAQAAVESGAVVDAEGDMERTTVLDEE
jgi:hypothetical protein